MLQSYQDIVADDPRAARRAEGAAFDRVLATLARAQRDGSDRRLAGEALDGVDQLWRALMGDLADGGNALPDALRAQLISIGLWTLTEVSRITTAGTTDFGGLIAVNSSIRDGLR